jgi:hypothetical protein
MPLAAEPVKLPPSVPAEKRPSHRRRFNTIKECVEALILEVDYVDENGRQVGFRYDVILGRVRRYFHRIVYPGPRSGQKSKMDIKGLREIAYNMQRDNPGLRFPVRPRRKRHTKKKT